MRDSSTAEVGRQDCLFLRIEASSRRFGLDASYQEGSSFPPNDAMSRRRTRQAVWTLALRATRSSDPLSSAEHPPVTRTAVEGRPLAFAPKPEETPATPCRATDSNTLLALRAANSLAPSRELLHDVVTVTNAKNDQLTHGVIRLCFESVGTLGDHLGECCAT